MFSTAAKMFTIILLMIAFLSQSINLVVAAPCDESDVSISHIETHEDDEQEGEAPPRLAEASGSQKTGTHG